MILNPAFVACESCGKLNLIDALNPLGRCVCGDQAIKPAEIKMTIQDKAFFIALDMGFVA